MISTGDLLTHVTALRRRLHRDPELGHAEWRTAELIETSLRDLGLRPFRPAATSVAVIVGPPDGRPRIGFRADLDALSILERSEVPYRSQTPGLMHACGHDGHAAALVGVAILLQQVELRKPVLLVFQQGEEAYPSGAPLVLEGLPDELLPDEFVGFHLWPQLPEGVVGVRAGPLMGAVADLEISIAGRPGRQHGSECDAGAVDALAAGVEVYGRLRDRFPAGRQFPAGASSVLAIGMAAGGEAPNVTALHCSLRGTLRAVSWPEQAAAVREIRAIAADVASQTASQITVRVLLGVRPPVSNDPDAATRVERACQTLGIPHRSYPDRPLGVSDDFGWYLDERPGVMVLVGCGADDRHPDLHDPSFDFREQVLLVPIRIAAHLAADPS